LSKASRKETADGKLHRVIAPLVSMNANYSVLKYRYETIFKKYYIVSMKM